MKCNKCPKVATLHITEIITDEQVEEHHLCEDCAQKYLYDPNPKSSKSPTPNLRREGIAAEGATELESLIADLNDQMLAAAGELKFELAARLRDELADLKRDLRQMEKAGHLT